MIPLLVSRTFALFRALAVGLLALLAFTSPALAQREDPRNAAPLYLRAADVAANLSDDDITVIHDAQTSLRAGTLRPALSRAFSAIDFATRASHLPYCDFHLDHSQGLELLLPHLSSLRKAAFCLHGHAILQLHDANPAAAAESISAMYRMARHLSSDSTIISSLVGSAIFALADSTAQYAFDRALFTPAHSATLFSAVSSIPATDPFSLGEALVMEQNVIIDYIDRTFADAADSAQPAEVLRNVIAASASPDPDLQALEPLADPQTLSDELAKYDAFMTQAVTAFSNPDEVQAAAQLAALETSAAAGNSGLLASILSPSFSRIHASMLRSQNALAERTAMLLLQMNNQTPPLQAANAALWYLRAIDSLSAIPPAHLDSIRQSADHPDAPPLPDLAAALKSAHPTLVTLRQAAQIPRCDFRALLELEPDQQFFAAPYLPGLLDCHRIAIASALVAASAIHNSDAQPSVQTPATASTQPAAFRAALQDSIAALQLSAHLSIDSALLSSLVSHQLFNRTLAALQSPSLAPLLAPEHRQPLYLIVKSISRKDPFNYITNIAAARHYAASLPASYSPPQTQDHQQGIADAVQSIANLNANQLLNLLTITQFIAHPPSAAPHALPQPSETQPAAAAPAPPPAHSLPNQSLVAPVPLAPRSPRDYLLPFAPMISLEDLDHLHALLPQLAPRLAMTDWSCFADLAAPPPADLNRLMVQSRADLRSATLLLQPPQLNAQPHPPAAPSQGSLTSPGTP